LDGAARSSEKLLSANKSLFLPEKQGETWKLTLFGVESPWILPLISMRCAGYGSESEQAKFGQYQDVTGGFIG
jgi:hypothetical protein